MIRVLAAALFAAALFAEPGLARSPPAGSGAPVQAKKTGNYTVKSTDLRTTIPFDCATPCTVTMPNSTASWPKGYPVTILNAGATIVTVTVQAPPTSMIYGMVPAGSSQVLLPAQGNYAVLTADASNNYLAYGVTGAVIATTALLIDIGSRLLIDIGSVLLIQ